MIIDKFRKIENSKGPLKATFLVTIPEWDVNMRISYFKGDKGQTWFGYPSQPYTNAQGEKKHMWLAYFGEKGKARFEEALKKELTSYLNQLQEPEPETYEQEMPF